MTCRHHPHDPACLGFQGRVSDARKLLAKTDGELLDRTPNPSRYAITRHVQVGSYLVLEVQYSACAACSFDSRKVMVFEGVAVGDALYWTRLDPHFRERTPDDAREVAPAPRARFPADEEGWADALAYARTKGAHS